MSSRQHDRSRSREAQKLRDLDGKTIRSFLLDAKTRISLKLETHVATEKTPYHRVQEAKIKFGIDPVTLKHLTRNKDYREFRGGNLEEKIQLTDETEVLPNLRVDPITKDFPIVLPSAYHTNWESARDHIRTIYQNDMWDYFSPTIPAPPKAVKVTEEEIWDQVIILNLLQIP